jgi:hypothetical protein
MKFDRQFAMPNLETFSIAPTQFRVGQIVCTKGGKELPFRIIEVIENDLGVFYKWNRRNAMAESSVRASLMRKKVLSVRFKTSKPMSGRYLSHRVMLRETRRRKSHQRGREEALLEVLKNEVWEWIYENKD